ncbi:TetR family transcriptional regulator [Chondromyces apiculatus]|uniref:Transcriptional regulator, TetR family n=1 Tax=Chondromyces apiculatus DSM 436 TaxID=1192034 RepID=A0A017T6D1_9BACT|nr:TetR family transcriptional regulator [Chondromyces apiculatus]EYF04126.1 Transcriptional regulator, TetR family [Chondromyces apiculatus DSM 436]
MRDSEATRKRLLDAARQEFAQFGIAGARVDRIAEAAGSNKAQIYHYFESKDGLFKAVFESIVASTVEETPIDVTDLPGYAAKLARGYQEHPDILRLATWNRLERANEPPVQLSVTSIRHKIDAIAKGQAEGIVPKHFPPDVLLLLILHLAAVWADVNPEQAAATSRPTAQQQRDIVADAVRRLLRPDRGRTRG